MVENGTPFSFADLVERVSPAVVSVTAEAMQTDEPGGLPDNMPDPFRELFKQFNQGRPSPGAQGRVDGLGLHHRQVWPDREQQSRHRRLQEDHSEAARRAQL